MSRRVAAAVAFTLAVAATGAAARAQDAAALVATHCAECHSGPDATRGFDATALFAAPAHDKAGADTAAAARRERAQQALLRVRSHTMPPPDADAQPDTTARRALVAAFAALTPAEAGARVASARRLTRLQYERSVRDLVGVQWSARDQLPEDPRVHGFDTIGDASGVTPALFEVYTRAASAIADAVLADPQRRERAFPKALPREQAIARLLGRAFRRPAHDDEIEGRQALFADVRAASGSDDRALAAVLQSVFASPAFLLRTEVGRDDGPARLSDHELAGRLSYLLAASTPDDELLAAADRGELSATNGLAQQARRLIAADGGRALADDFAAQWLRFRDVLAANADFRRYPEIWNGRLRPAFYEEAAAFFAAIARDDLSVLTLLDSDFTYANSALAKHYGLPPVQGDAFVRVPLSDRRRGGVLGMGAMLMVASYPLRTSPVQRGRWILDALLDLTPPPPPPGTGSLPAEDTPKGDQSLRAQLERHRSSRSCASCHAQMDPLGFALENFDVLGTWRDELHGQRIDAAGVLPDGVRVDGPIGLKDALLARQDEFVRTFAARLLAFAVGRPMLPADEAELLRIGAASARGGHRFTALLDAVLASPLFLLRDPDAVGAPLPPTEGR
jgi:mono/diheme cytochrome c family protein